MHKKVVLEEAAKQVSIQNSKPPLIFQLPPAEGRKVLDKAQDAPVDKMPVRIEDIEMDTGEHGCINVRFLAPENSRGEKLNIIFFIHGAGWVFGDAHTHDKLVRELANRTHSIVIFPEYTRSPEAKYPVAIEQCFSILKKVPALAQRNGWNLDTLTVAGDSVGGNMATVMTIMAKERGFDYITKQLLYYPVTNACFDTESYNQFATDYYLYKAGMEWFWDQYTTSECERNQITASPLRATVDQLRGLPAAMILNGEADVLRDEGEAYANKLREAGVDVTQLQFQGMIHDFVMLNALDQTDACRAAMDVSTAWVNRLNDKIMDGDNGDDGDGDGCDCGCGCDD